MSNKNQISSIKKFISSNEEAILINQVNDEIGILYLGIIEYYANHHSIKIKFNSHTDNILAEDDLFGTKTIQAISISSTKKLDSLLDVHTKKIVFTDYKNYKRLNSKFSCINGYQFENDINFFIKNELKINNEELINFCKNNVALLFSETSKYLINSNRYSGDHSLIEDKNHVLNIRKSIFEIKRNNFNIKSLYQNIKQEAEYKKLSFLTF